MNHLKAQIVNEFVKLIKNKINYIYFSAILIIAICSYFGIKLLENSNSPTTGYSYVLLSLQTFFSTVMPFMLLLFSASIVSSEKSTGTIRNILATGCSKNQFLISKIIVSFLFQLILTVIVAIISILVGYLTFGFTDIREESFLIMTQQQFWIQFLVAYGILSVALFAVTAFGIMISTIAHNVISAITLAISSYIVMEGVKAKLHIENFIFSTYIEFPLNIVSEFVEGFYPSWTPKIYWYFFVSCAWIIISLTISFFILKKLEFK
jgi:ABC-2 type transport system permease protein